MPREGFTTITLPTDLVVRMREIAPQIGFFGETGVPQRIMEHMVKLAETRPDFFHVVNRKRKWPPINKRYATEQ